MDSRMQEKAWHLAMADVHPSRVNSVVIAGAVGALRGRLAEERLRDLLRLWRERPWWILRVRCADTGSPEDQDGLDILVDTDAGLVALQVKCSRKRAQEWRSRERSRSSPRCTPVAVVVAPPELDDTTVLQRAVEALIALRDAELAKQDR